MFLCFGVVGCAKPFQPFTEVQRDPGGGVAEEMQNF
jgi:hypothetical protein